MFQLLLKLKLVTAATQEAIPVAVEETAPQAAVGAGL
jgi:hypothetical protein